MPRRSPERRSSSIEGRRLALGRHALLGSRLRGVFLLRLLGRLLWRSVLHLVLGQSILGLALRSRGRGRGVDRPLAVNALGTQVVLALAGRKATVLHTPRRPAAACIHAGLVL